MNTKSSQERNEKVLAITIETGNPKPHIGACFGVYYHQPDLLMTQLANKRQWPDDKTASKCTARVWGNWMHGLAQLKVLKILSLALLYC